MQVSIVFLKRSRSVAQVSCARELAVAADSCRATTCRVPHLHWGQDRLSADFCGSVSSALLSGADGVEMDPAQGEGLAAVAVGEQSEVADLDEAGRGGRGAGSGG